MTYQQPLLLIFIAVATVGLLRVRAPARSKAIAGIGIAGVFLCSWPPAEWLYSRLLTAQYATRPFAPLARPQAIVVFGESGDPPVFERPFALAGENTYSRCEYAAWIYGRYGPVPVLVSGGRTARSAPPVSATMAQLLLRDGIPGEMIWEEDRSRSTRENALYCASILREHGLSRIALVVDATSMPRAAACLRKLGIEVMPAPSAFDDLGPWQDEILPNWRALRRNEDTLHELVGFAWYWIRGWV
jgi:uncharacterized SAM-binding protein YcdF (DUF218 family)